MLLGPSVIPEPIPMNFSRNYDLSLHMIFIPVQAKPWVDANKVT